MGRNRDREARVHGETLASVGTDQGCASPGGHLRLPFVAPVGLGETDTLSGIYAALGRLADVLVASVGLIALGPVLLVTALIVLLDSPGHPIYSQQRVGRYGRVFRLFKLRTMVVHAEADGRAVWARRRDPRVTRVGSFLRRSRLDEIPQLWNVLRGEMSLIGPRPERPEFVALLTSEIPRYPARHLIRPGITGWAQVNCEYGSSIEDSVKKLQYDLFYLHQRSLLLDLTILWRTLLIVLQFRGV